MILWEKFINNYEELRPWSWTWVQSSASPLTSKMKIRMWVHAAAQSCPTLCDSMDYSPPGSSVHGISQERILDWVAISFSRGSSRPRDQTHVSCISCIGGQILYHCATWEACVLLTIRLHGHSLLLVSRIFPQIVSVLFLWPVLAFLALGSAACNRTTVFRPASPSRGAS